MKVLVVSDSHGNIANLKHVMGFGKKIKVGAVIHCGDWNNVESIKAVLSFGIPLYSVLGNADIDPKVEKLLSNKCKKFDQLFLKLELGGRKIGVVHNIKNLEIGNTNLDIVFFGHWQKQKDTFWNGVRAVNPGAFENDINFVVYDTIGGEVEFLND